MTAPDWRYAYLLTPLGKMELACDSSGLTRAEFMSTEDPEKEISENEILKNAKHQLEKFFGGQLQNFELPVSPKGTDFQQKVWNELCKIPFGKTISYVDLAKKLGDPKCIRAAASANGKNPLAIIIPCHRVIGSNGSLVGYAGGMERKKWLLDHESSQSRLF